MSGEANTEVKASPAPTTTENAASQKPAAGTGGGSGEASKSETKEDAKAGKASETEESKTITIGDDDYEVGADGYVRIPATAFKKRMNRHTKAQLREWFGTDDADELKARFAEHGKLKAKDEEERQKTLAKEQKLSEDLEKERAARKKAEETATRLAEEREYRESDREVTKAASQHVKEKYLDYATYKFGKHVAELDDDEANALKQKDVTAWFKNFVSENPEYGKDAAEPKKEPKEEGDSKPKVAKPLSHGAGDKGAPPPPKEAPGGKTPRPGKANSMTDEEYRAWKREQGINA